MENTIELKLFELLDKELYPNKQYGQIRLLEGIDSIIEYAKEEGIKLYLLVDGYYQFEETRKYKVIQVVDYNGDGNIGYDSVHLIVLNKETLETKDYYLHLAQSEDY